MAKERVNIYTIAKEAGVSPATVSRVMTNNAKVSKERKDRVEAVIRKYDYTPNALAQGLSTAKTHTIGILIADISSPFYTRVATECERFANSKNYMLMMLSSLSDYELEKRQLMKLYEQQVDAIIIVGGRIDHVTADEEYVEMINRINAVTPIVSTGKLPGADNLQVCLDEGGSMDLAMEYLIGLGHRRIGLIGGAKQAKSSFEKRMRYRAMLRSHGIECREELVLESDYTRADGYACMKQFLQMKERPSAVVAINDSVASGVIQAMHEADLGIPEDISLVSFDNTSLSEAVSPQLTSVGCDYAKFAEKLVQTAINASNEKKQPMVQVVPVDIVYRDSCAKPTGIGKGTVLQ